MLLDETGVGNPRDLAAHRLMVAREDLETANDDFRGNHLRAANNRAYYSIYHSRQKSR